MGSLIFIIHEGNVVDVVDTLEDDSVDAVFCDPPYGLNFMGHDWDGSVPDELVWRKAIRVAKPGAHLLAFGGTRTYHRLACAIEDAGWEIRDCIMWLYGSGFPKSLNGPWGGTALKPAWEPVIVARKPLEGTMARNAERWGVGGMAIDACRIAAEKPIASHNGTGRGVAPFSSNGPQKYRPGDAGKFVQTDGRWPANVILDEEAGAMLDAQTGELGKSTGGRIRSGKSGQNAYGKDLRLEVGDPGFGDSGGASRFFYTAKVSRAERELGCEHLEPKTAGEATGGREDGSLGLNSPRAGASRGGGARNHHPTLKPISLTTYLARLVMPPNPGRILVPFSGAGSEMIGCIRAGWPDVVGIELSPEYAEIARSRIAHWSQRHPSELRQPSLFGE